MFRWLRRKNRQDPRAFLATDDPGPVGFDAVLEKELETISELRRRREVEADGAPADPADRPPVAQAHRSRLVGLAFSGGGIRSATFNLGVTQALAQLGLLRYFDYLSTVSGGGYIGSWLVAWIKRRGRRHVEAGLQSEHGCNPSKLGDTPGEPESPSPIRFLRTYSNYLTPQRGFFSLDSWMAVVSYLRNFFLNMTLLVLFLSLLLFLPRLFVSGFYSLLDVLHRVLPKGAWNDLFLQIRPIDLAIFALGIALLAAPAAKAVARAMEVDWTRSEPGKAGSGGVLLRGVLPIFGLSALLAFWLFSDARADRLWSWVWRGAVAFFGFWLIVSLFWWRYWLRKQRRDQRRYKGWPEVRVWAGALALALAAGGATSWVLALGAGRWARSAQHADVEWLQYWIWAPPTIALMFLFMGILYMGLLGRLMPEEDRQWWSRLGGWLTLLALGWVALFAATFYAPPLLEYAWAKLSAYVLGAISLSWVVSTAAGIVAGRSSSTNDKESSPRLELIAKVAPYVFIAGLIALLSLGNHRLYPVLQEKAEAHCADASKSQADESQASDDGFDIAVLLPCPTTHENPRPGKLEAVPGTLSGFVADELEASAQGMSGRFRLLTLLATLLFAAALLLSWRLDINQFSMHNFYRDRLTRPYLGASRQEERFPNPFTGFDPEDDLFLDRLLEERVPEEAGSGHDGDGSRRYDGPFPIINTALNVTSGTDQLAWQERQANSFFFSPLFYGFDPGPQESTTGAAPIYGYRSTKAAFRRRLGGQEPGVRLGTAMAVSGAAVNPNMGVHSSPPLAFLLTFFNARLGLWMGNPAHPESFAHAAPAVALVSLVKELFGMTNARSPYVNLTDGGFFDNTGIYELVRRRCRFILACDAGADGKVAFDDLGNAIRRCRADFGIDVRFDTDPIRLDPDTGLSRWHCAVGTIHYDRVDQNAPKGILVYLKASLTGDEPNDVLNYRSRNPAFPHEPTGDQWFEESQFESYRRLGQHIALKMFGAINLKPNRHACDLGKPGASGLKNVEAIFVGLRRAWYPPALAGTTTFSRHTATLTRLFSKLRGDPDLAFLDREIYRDLPDLPACVEPEAKGDGAELGKTATSLDRSRFRKGFYLCNELIQLMEDVYRDLHLDQDWRHPDNRGWMNLFRYWSHSDMFRQAWALSASTYGLRFQEFCERRLELELGRLEVQEIWSGDDHAGTFDQASAFRLLEGEEADFLHALWPAGTNNHGHPMAGRFSKLLAGRLVARSARGVLRDRLELPSSDGSTDLLPLTFGFALLDPEDRLTFLRIRPPLRRLGLGRRLLMALVEEQGCRGTNLPTEEGLRALRMRGDLTRLENMFKSVLNEFDLGQMK